jgi:hypothetical protein
MVFFCSCRLILHFYAYRLIPSIHGSVLTLFCSFFLFTSFPSLLSLASSFHSFSLFSIFFLFFILRILNIQYVERRIFLKDLAELYLPRLYVANPARFTCLYKSYCTYWPKRRETETIIKVMQCKLLMGILSLNR